MNWNDFQSAVRGGDIAPVYLFTGPEEYLKREALNLLREKLLPPGLEALNDVTLEGITAHDITDAAETLPMMCERRIVTVRDWAPLMPGKSKNEDAEADWMRQWLEHPSPQCALVFYMRGDMDARKKLPALLKKRAINVVFDYLTDAELAKWCQKRAKAQGKRIAPPTVNALTFMAGRELTRLCGEMDKLCAYVGEDGAEITPEHVKTIVSPSLEYNVFELMNHLLAGDMLKAQQTVNSLLQGGQNAMGILAMLNRQLRQLAHMKCALDAGSNVQTVQNQLKLHPYAAKQTARQCAKLPAQWLTKMYDMGVEADFAVKSGRLRDADALNRMLFGIGLSKRSTEPARRSVV